MDAPLSLSLDPALSLSLSNRRSEIFQPQEQSHIRSNNQSAQEDRSDETLHDLKGSIELGFEFNEEEGQKFCNTLPTLDLYFTVNRTVSLKASAPHLRRCLWSRSRRRRRLGCRALSISLGAIRIPEDRQSSRKG